MSTLAFPESIAHARHDALATGHLAHLGALRIAGPDAINLRTEVAMRGEDFTTRAEFAVAEGQPTIARNCSGRCLSVWKIERRFIQKVGRMPT